MRRKPVVPALAAYTAILGRMTFWVAGRKVPVLLSVLLLAVSASAADKEEEDTAYNLYKVRCALCHYVERPEVKFGPSLKDLFKRENLMNGKPVNEQNVSEWIANGSAKMPGFRYTLNQKEIQLVVSYVKGDLGKPSSR